MCIVQMMRQNALPIIYLRNGINFRVVGGFPPKFSKIHEQS